MVTVPTFPKVTVALFVPLNVVPVVLEPSMEYVIVPPEFEVAFKVILSDP